MSRTDDRRDTHREYMESLPSAERSYLLAIEQNPPENREIPFSICHWSYSPFQISQFSPMCWIFWYLGRTGSASREIIAGLQRLEYRGYDSAGMSVVNHKREIRTLKSVWKVGNLKIKSETFDMESYHVGIGHTRWATHGWVTEANCHPHLSQSGRFAVVHNGIIENYRTLKDELIEKWYTFDSDTDTEIVVKLFEDAFLPLTKAGKDAHVIALEKVIAKIEGAYWLVFLDREFPDHLFGAKKGSPLVIGFAPRTDGVPNERFISSDYRSLIGLIDEYVILEDGDIFMVSPDDYTIISGGNSISRAIQQIDETEKSTELRDFPHFMLQEIWEQPRVIEDVFRGRINFETHELHSDTLAALTAEPIERIVIVAPWTAYISWILGKYYLEELANIPTEVVISAEFKYQKKFITPTTLFVFVSQSGETADTVDSLKIVKEQWGRVFGIVNVPWSSIARITWHGLFTRAGTEIGVASTKAFTGMIACFLFLALSFWKKRGMDYGLYREILDGLKLLPERMHELLRASEMVRSVAERYAHVHDFFFLGRTHELAIAMEGSLKLKELSYIHAEAYSSWELKHGPIALIDEHFPTLIVNGGWSLIAKNTSTLEEVKARSGKVIGIIAEGDTSAHLYTDTLTFRAIHPILNPFLEVIIVQLFAYYIANALGRDIDTPRNLAKSVTVE